MTTSTKSFFSEEKNAAVVRNFAAKLSAMAPIEPPNPEVVRPLTLFFRIFSQNLAAFDQYCPVNIEWVGSGYIGRLVSFLEEKPEKSHELLMDIFTTSYRFLCELEFSQPGNLSFELRGITAFVDENLEKFQDTDRRQLIFASYTMPARIMKRILEDSSLGDFKVFSETAAAAKQLKEQWDKEIAAKNEETKGLQDSINQLQTKFNFVGLVKGFENIVTNKKREAGSSFLALIGIGLLMVVPVCAQLSFVLLHVNEIEEHRTTLIYSLPALLTLEFILLYFFRVILAHFRGLQAQLLQLNLRASLCQFIQSYSDYSSKIKKSDPSALERFEAIIFSAITSDAEKMPATFDGVEQLAKLVSSLRQK